jgi:hypothetical protein
MYVTGPTGGRLVTVFSAPDYPQFQAVGRDEDRTRNKAAVATLAGPAWDDPEFVQFEAALPRPEVGGRGGAHGCVVLRAGVGCLVLRAPDGALAILLPVQSDPMFRYQERSNIAASRLQPRCEVILNPGTRAKKLTCRRCLTTTLTP